MADNTVYTDLKLLSYPEFEAVFLHEAKEHDLPILEHRDGRLCIDAEYGSFGITEQPDGLRLDISAQETDKLHMIREGVVDHLLHAMPALKDSLVWSDNMKIGEYPENFQFVEILESAPLNADFHRLKIRLSKPEQFVSGALHFRFVLPAPDNTDPDWPVLNASGSTTWPSGDKELHRPVYTARHFDDASGTAIVDVFDHEGGRAIAWAKATKPGMTAAMTGPGGARIPDAKDLVICGDETAYPAIGRILDALPDATGEVFLLNHSGRKSYDITCPAGMSLTWITPEDAQSLANAAEAAMMRRPDATVWFAAEGAETDQLRQCQTVQDRPKAITKIARYWARNAPSL